MWRVVYIAHNRQIAEQIKSLLTQEGFLVTVRQANVIEGMGAGLFEVLVPHSEVEEASETINEMLVTRTGLAGGDPAGGDPAR